MVTIRPMKTDPQVQSLRYFYTAQIIAGNDCEPISDKGFAMIKTQTEGFQ